MSTLAFAFAVLALWCSWVANGARIGGISQNSGGINVDTTAVRTAYRHNPNQGRLIFFVDTFQEMTNSGFGVWRDHSTHKYGNTVEFEVDASASISSFVDTFSRYSSTLLDDYNFNIVISTEADMLAAFSERIYQYEDSDGSVRMGTADDLESNFILDRHYSGHPVYGEPIASKSFGHAKPKQSKLGYEEVNLVSDQEVNSVSEQDAESFLNEFYPPTIFLFNGSPEDIDGSNNTMYDVIVSKRLYLRVFFDRRVKLDLDNDIGVFQAATHTPASLILDLVGAAPRAAVSAVVKSLGGRAEASFALLPSVFVGPDERRALRALADAAFHAEPEPWSEARDARGRPVQGSGEGGDSREDLKLRLDVGQLRDLLGQERVDALAATFRAAAASAGAALQVPVLGHSSAVQAAAATGDAAAGHAFAIPWDQVILRRCSALGKRIHLHVDHSRLTMQVALGEEDEYQGGRLVYASVGGEMQAPRRPAGSAIVHDWRIAHGVTELLSGVRFGLFFLLDANGAAEAVSGHSAR